MFETPYAWQPVPRSELIVQVMAHAGRVEVEMGAAADETEDCAVTKGNRREAKAKKGVDNMLSEDETARRESLLFRVYGRREKSERAAELVAGVELVSSERSVR